MPVKIATTFHEMEQGNEVPRDAQRRADGFVAPRSVHDRRDRALHFLLPQRIGLAALEEGYVLVANCGIEDHRLVSTRSMRSLMKLIFSSIDFSFSVMTCN